MDIFERASREKLRFKSTHGQITVEDLWCLPLINERGGLCLNTLAKNLSRQLRDENEENFVEPISPQKSLSLLKLEVVKHIIKVKIEERDSKTEELKKETKKKQILGILADKEENSLKNMSEQELRKMLDSL